jgi:hypothetical protein
LRAVLDIYRTSAGAEIDLLLELPVSSFELRQRHNGDAATMADHSSA